MAFQKFASADVLAVKSTGERLKTASLDKFAEYDDYRTDDGYLYVRVRAISSRVNKNHDGWPSAELDKSWRTFIGKPIFVDHHNHDPSRARGVIADAKIHVEDSQKAAALDPYYASAPAAHKPPTWIELLLEVDAKRFPKLAKAIISGEIDSVSMGANVEMSKCSHCGNEAATPDEFCNHIRSKGALHDFVDEHGTKTSKKSYEDCYKIGFFEISFVFDPADETALVSADSIRHAHVANAVNAEGMQHVAGIPSWFHDAALAGYIPALYVGSKLGELWQNYQARFGDQPAPPEEIGQRVQEIAPAIQEGVDTKPQFYDQTQDPNPIVPRTADRHNDPPQSEMQTAPDKVNTLRQEQVCPVCGSAMDDGVCSVCNYEEPPEGFDNPDLEKAQEVDQEMRQDQAAGQQETPIPGEADQGAPVPPAPAGASPVQASTNSVQDPKTVSGDSLNEMSRTAGQNDGPGRVNVQEKPLLPPGRQTTDKPKSAQTVEDHRQPVESNVKGATDMTQHTADGPTPHGGADTAPDARVDVEGVGGVMDKPLSGIEHQNVEKSVNVTGPKTDTFGDNGTDAVTNDTFPAKGDGVKASHEHEAAAILNEDHAKTIDVEKPLTDDSKVADGTKTFGNPPNRTTNPVTDENFPASADGVKAARAEGRRHALACVKLADTEVELGITNPTDKHNRISELEELSLAEVEAEARTLARVRTAGLRRPAQANKTAATRIPSLHGTRTAAVDPSEHAAPSQDQEVQDMQAFMR